MKKINIIGTGNRFKDYIYDILLNYIRKKNIVITGICNRSGNLDENIKNNLNIKKIYTDYEVMLENTEKDIIIILLNKDSIILNILMYLINKNSDVFILCETHPFSNMKFYHLEKIIKSNVKVGILENWFLHPVEIFKKKIINNDIIGDIIKVENSYMTFFYHGTAQLRNYIKDSNVDFYNSKIINRDNNILECYFNNLHFINKSRNRITNSLRNKDNEFMYIYGTKGYIKSKNYITKTKKDFKYCGPFEIEIYRKKKKQKIDIKIKNNKVIHILLNFKDKNIEWKNKNLFLNDEEQHGIIQHFESLLFNNKILYSIKDFYLDLIYSNIDDDRYNDLEKIKEINK